MRRLLLLALLCAACGSPAPEGSDWTPFEADLLFSSDRDGNSEIYLLESGQTEWRNLTNDPAQDNWPEWSPDGTRIVFQSMRSGNLDIWSMNADGSDLAQLTDDPAHDYLPTWAPDGERIVFASWRAGPDESTAIVHHYTMNADGTEQTRLPGDPPGTSTPAMVSPDGETILLSRKFSADGADVCLVGPDGRLLRRLTEDPAHDGAPAFSPDGRRIAYYADRGMRSSLWVIDVDGSGARPLREEGRNWYPRWSPDGDWIVYAAAVDETDAGNLDLFAMRVDGRGEPLLLVGGPKRESEGRWRPLAR